MHIRADFKLYAFENLTRRNLPLGLAATIEGFSKLDKNGVIVTLN